MKKILLTTIVLMMSLLAVDKPVKQMDMSTNDMSKQNQEIAKLAAVEINKTLPHKIDQYTNLVDIVAKGATLVYTFEINTGGKSDDAVRLEDHSRMQRAVTGGVCRSSIRFLNANINISYIYSSAISKKELFRFDITKEKCTAGRNH